MPPLQNNIPTLDPKPTPEVPKGNERGVFKDIEKLMFVSACTMAGIVIARFASGHPLPPWLSDPMQAGAIALNVVNVAGSAIQWWKNDRELIEDPNADWDHHQPNPAKMVLFNAFYAIATQTFIAMISS